MLDAKAAAVCVAAEAASSDAGAASTSSKAPQEPSAPRDSVLEELRQLSRHLAAVRAQVDKHFQGSRWTKEWEMIGKVLDRFLFGLYIILITVTFVTIIAIWIWNNSYER